MPNSRGKGKGGSGRLPVGERRRRAAAQALGVTTAQKRHLDAMHARSQELYGGLGIGVIVQEEARHRREAESHAAERARITGWRRLMGRVLWPGSRWHELRRMEQVAQTRSEEWSRRLKRIAADVARQTPDEAQAQAVRGER